VETVAAEQVAATVPFSTSAQSYAITDRLREQEEAAEAPRGPIPFAAAAEGRLRSGSGPQ
jgi:hypothetical protein